MPQPDGPPLAYYLNRSLYSHRKLFTGSACEARSAWMLTVRSAISIAAAPGRRRLYHPVVSTGPIVPISHQPLSGKRHSSR